MLLHRRENISQMRQEFEYWTSEHFMTVTLADGSEHRLARYIVMTLS